MSFSIFAFVCGWISWTWFHLSTERSIYTCVAIVNVCWLTWIAVIMLRLHLAKIKVVRLLSESDYWTTFVCLAKSMCRDLMLSSPVSSIYPDRLRREMAWNTEALKFGHTPVHLLPLSWSPSLSPPCWITTSTTPLSRLPLSTSLSTL